MARFRLRPICAGLLLVLPLVATSCMRPPADSARAPGATPASTTAPHLEPWSGAEVQVQKYIVVDQFGYRPEMAKVAVLVDPQEGWNADDSFAPGQNYEVRRWADGSVVHSGGITAWQNGEVQPNAGDRGWWFDFSSITEPGSYFVYDKDNHVRSHRFEIGKDVYRDVLKAAVRMFYFNRANFEKKKPFACVGDKCWEHRADYLGPGQDREVRSVADRDNPKTARDLSGGWWDAGDVNKYTTFAMDPIHQLLTAYEEHPGPFTDDYNIPESGNGIPDLIDEIKVEIDFLKKMQPSDLRGGAIVKMGNIEHGDPLPQDSKFPRYYYPEPCSSGTIVLASIFSHTALVYAGFEKIAGETDELKRRAVEAWKHYHNNPRNDACDDGTIKSGDADRTLAQQDELEVVAAVYLFALTGKDEYHDVVKKGYRRGRPFREDRWSVYDQAYGNALLFYAALPNANAQVKKAILDQKRSQARSVEIYQFRPELDLYRAYMREDSYHWGSNNARAGFGNTNYDMIQHKLAGPGEKQTYLTRVAGILHSFHGVNPIQLVYLSNMGHSGAEASATEMFHTWFRDGHPDYDSSKTSTLGPAPGYVTGGANKQYCKGQDPAKHRCVNSELTRQPAQKAYLDFNTSWAPEKEHDKSWEITEPAIYYQASYVRLVSKFVD
jgi:endoglucanase